MFSLQISSSSLHKTGRWLAIIVSFIYVLFPSSEKFAEIDLPVEQDLFSEEVMTESAALMDIYLELGGDSWISNENWNFGDPCSFNWFGVTCNTSGKVISIQLSANNLAGELSANNGFCMLPFLTSLDISNNTITGVLPSCLFTSNKDQLLLQNNSFSGALPSSVSQVQNTIQMRVNNNQLTGCYGNELIPRCGSSSFSDFTISNGNNFDAPWSQFCSVGDGVLTIIHLISMWSKQEHITHRGILSYLVT